MTALKKHWIWVALVIAALASCWVSGLDDETIYTDKRNASANSPSGKPGLAKKAGPAQYNPAQALALIGKGFTPREGMSKLRRDPFAVVSFAPAPPPPPPPKPTAPPLKFRYLGVLHEDNAHAIFLDSGGGQLLIARKGDTLAGQYLVLDISDTQMQLEYTPLAERQTLNFGR